MLRLGSRLGKFLKKNGNCVGGLGKITQQGLFNVKARIIEEGTVVLCGPCFIHLCALIQARMVIMNYYDSCIHKFWFIWLFIDVSMYMCTHVLRPPPSPSFSTFPRLHLPLTMPIWWLSGFENTNYTYSPYPAKTSAGKGRWRCSSWRWGGMGPRW